MSQIHSRNHMGFGAENDASSGECTRLTILGTSDIHGNVWGYDYGADTETPWDGAARLHTYISRVRAENPNTILIDNGDAIQGSAISDIYTDAASEKPHPMITAMNRMGYDAMTLGNHEFSRGVPAMKAVLSQAEFPVLCANALDGSGAPITGRGWVILERAGLRVAVIGVVTPFVPFWDGDKEGVVGLRFRAASDSVKAAIAEIGGRADIIVVSAHMGMYAEFDEDNGSDSARKILDDNPEIDALLFGHMHFAASALHGNTPVGASRSGGRDAVRFDLTIGADRRVIGARVKTVSMDGHEPSQDIRGIVSVAAAHDNARRRTVKTPVEARGDDRVLGCSTGEFLPKDEIAGIPSARIMDTALFDLINKIQLEYSGADVSAAPIMSNKARLPVGKITLSDVRSIYKFNNALYRLTVTGAELKAYMEWSAGCFNQWKPGDMTISFDPEYLEYQYDVFAGVDYEIDISQPKGRRIKNVMFRGEPLEDDRRLTLAVSNYRYASALKSFSLVSGKREWESPCSIREMIAEYISGHSPISPESDDNWRIVGIDLRTDDPRRARIISMVNSGELAAPYYRSINIADLK